MKNDSADDLYAEVLHPQTSPGSFAADRKGFGEQRIEGFTLTVREVKLSAGAEFIVVLTGAIMTMPGLPKKPAAFSIDVDDDGNITGLF